MLSRYGQATPADPVERIEVLDALRGLALFGVLLMNLETAFRVSMFEDFLPPRTHGVLDRAVEVALRVFVDLKAFAIFSLLFGAGLAIQHARLEAHSARLLLLVRRLLVLLIFGLIHLYLIWNGDILTEYAIAGLVVLPFLFGPRWLLSCGAATFLALYLAMQVWSPPGLFPSLASLQRHVLEANQVYAGGSFGQVLAFRVSEIPVIVPLHIYVFPRTI